MYLMWRPLKTYIKPHAIGPIKQIYYITLEEKEQKFIYCFNFL